MTGWRYAICALFAGGVTVGLGLLMQSIVAVEFVPQETDRISSSSAPYTYKEVVKCEGCWDWVQTVAPPPAIPRLLGQHEPIIQFPSGKIIDCWRPELKLGTDRPLVRIPPTFPKRFLKGDVSGYCHVRFDVSPNGRPYNVVATLCTNSDLERPTIRSVQKWRYAPKIQNGRAVMQSGVEATVRFDLLDENGERLPLPEGF